jgi:AraC-like DNA-binding protein
LTDKGALNFRFTREMSTDVNQVEMFREVFGRSICKIEMNPLSGQPLDINMTLRALPELGIAGGTLSPMRNRHLAEVADNDDVVLVIFQEGTGELRQRGQETTVTAGQAVLTANGERGIFTGQTPTRLINLCFKRARLAAQVTDIGATLASPISLRVPALRLLENYVSAIRDEDQAASPETQQAIVHHLYDLAALTLGSTREAAHGAQAGGLQAARLTAIKADIAANLTRRDLSVDFLAVRHGISPRYIRSLFATEQTTFTDYLLRKRLMLAHRRLRDPRFAPHAISAIAYDVGFGDLSYFNHRFRRQFQATPSDIRATMLANDIGS